MSWKPQLETTLKNTFGFDSFREGQLEALETLLDRGRLLCIQPTGHGKSLLYQLPAAFLEGVTLVISPLLALMRDQEQQLNQRFRIPAGSLNSDQSDEENWHAKSGAQSGRLRVLFVAPEQLDDIDRFSFLLNLPLQLLVIDEAHCISTWGHDFRPSYRQILQFVQAAEQRHEQLRVLALTATADQRCQEDISAQLTDQGRPIEVRRYSMDRPNIRLSNLSVRGIDAKLAACETLVRKQQGTGLIYTATRENAELVGEHLRSVGIAAAGYHAGLQPAIKRQLQQDFIHDKFQVIAATNALGMGIDKSNLRYIVHFDVPGSITAYYQEVGRAGRDRLPAEGILLYDRADRRIQEYFIKSSQPTDLDFAAVMNVIQGSPEPLGLAAIKVRSGLHPTRVTVVLAELIEQGFLRKDKVMGRQVYLPTGKGGKPNLARYERQRQVKERELRAMLRYADQKSGCLMATLRRALGDQEAPPCGHCSCCTDNNYEGAVDPELALSARSWMDQRRLPIPAAVRAGLDEGFSLLDGKQRSPLFVQFMKQRQQANEADPKILELLIAAAKQQHEEEPIGCVIALPSRTWTARARYAQELARALGVPFTVDYLRWGEQPPARQGELLNNDQRRANVQGKMVRSSSNSLPAGSILLLDDYIGSGASLKEAARVLRNEGRPVRPVTVAAIRWRLGQSGMV